MYDSENDEYNEFAKIAKNLDMKKRADYRVEISDITMDNAEYLFLKCWNKMEILDHYMQIEDFDMLYFLLSLKKPDHYKCNNMYGNIDTIKIINTINYLGDKEDISCRFTLCLRFATCLKFYIKDFLNFVNLCDFDKSVKYEILFFSGGIPDLADHYILKLLELLKKDIDNGVKIPYEEYVLDLLIKYFHIDCEYVIDFFVIYGKYFNLNDNDFVSKMLLYVISENELNLLLSIPQQSIDLKKQPFLLKSCCSAGDIFSDKIETCDLIIKSILAGNIQIKDYRLFFPINVSTELLCMFAEFLSEMDHKLYKDLFIKLVIFGDINNQSDCKIQNDFEKICTIVDYMYDRGYVLEINLEDLYCLSDINILIHLILFFYSSGHILFADEIMLRYIDSIWDINLIVDIYHLFKKNNEMIQISIIPTLQDFTMTPTEVSNAMSKIIDRIDFIFTHQDVFIINTDKSIFNECVFVLFQLSAFNDYSSLKKIFDHLVSIEFFMSFKNVTYENVIYNLIEYSRINYLLWQSTLSSDIKIDDNVFEKVFIRILDDYLSYKIEIDDLIDEIINNTLEYKEKYTKIFQEARRKKYLLNKFGDLYYTD